MVEHTCKEHSGMCEAVSTLKDNVDSLWTKWNKMQTLLVSTLATAILSLVGVISTLIVMLLKK